MRFGYTNYTTPELQSSRVCLTPPPLLGLAALLLSLLASMGIAHTGWFFSLHQKKDYEARRGDAGPRGFDHARAAGGAPAAARAAGDAAHGATRVGRARGGAARVVRHRAASCGLIRQHTVSCDLKSVSSPFPASFISYGGSYALTAHAEEVVIASSPV